MIHKCPGFIKRDSVIKSCITQMKHNVWLTVSRGQNSQNMDDICDSWWKRCFNKWCNLLWHLNNQHYYRYELKQVQLKYQRNWNILQNKIWCKLEHIFLVWYIQKTIIINDVWFSKYISQPCFTLLTLFWEKKTIQNCLNNWFYISFQTLVKAIFELLN